MYLCRLVEAIRVHKVKLHQKIWYWEILKNEINTNSKDQIEHILINIIF